MSTPPPAVVWFRNDLRLRDNPALAAAATRGPIIPLFILDDGGGPRALGAASRWWLGRSLAALASELAALGAPLILRRGPCLQVLRDVAAESGARTAYWNRQYDAASIARDTEIKAALTDEGLDCHTYNGSLLHEPWKVKTSAGGPYRVFTPYWRAVRAMSANLAPAAGVLPAVVGAATLRSERLGSWRLHPCQPDWSAGFGDWRPGEAGAMARLDAFLDDGAADYVHGRDRPGAERTSRLSPHLRFGEISPHRVWAAVQSAVARGDAPEPQAEAFLRELGWREFNHHLLFHFPLIQTNGFNPRFADFAWREDTEGLNAWRGGRTGFPIVDAGMRQLWATGWMHNRVRMIAASFLVKDLMVDWRRGEAWFWDTLLDADLANNVCGWQWVAGCGADAAPYFRVFNPVLQGEKFDPSGDYVRRWVPELARLPNACIHQPWRAESDILAAAGVRLGETYPFPIVDHGEARNRALAAYERL